MTIQSRPATRKAALGRDDDDDGDVNDDDDKNLYEVGNETEVFTNSLVLGLQTY